MKCSLVLKIVFHGLLAFVPVKDADKQNLWAILVNAAETSTVPAPFFDLGKAASLCRSACSGCSSTALIGGQLHAHKAAVRYDGGEQIWLLNGYDLQIGAPGADSGVEIIDKRPAGRMIPDLDKPDEIADFSWVPEVAKITSRLGIINPDVIAKVPDKELGIRVAARMLLSRGRIQTGSVAVVESGGKLKPALFKFSPKVNADELKQALADTVLYTLEVKDVEVEAGKCNVTVMGKRFSDPSDVRTLVLEPVGGEVKLDIINVQKEFVVGGEEAHEHDDSGGENFLWFYKLSKNNLGPYPVPAILLTGDVTGKPYCPMAIFGGE